MINEHKGHKNLIGHQPGLKKHQHLAWLGHPYQVLYQNAMHKQAVKVSGPNVAEDKKQSNLAYPRRNICLRFTQKRP